MATARHACHRRSWGRPSRLPRCAAGDHPSGVCGCAVKVSDAKHGDGLDTQRRAV